MKETTRPVTTPSGRRRPPVTPAESAIGSTGTTQGDTAVAAPATKPKMMSRSHLSEAFHDFLTNR